VDQTEVPLEELRVVQALFVQFLHYSKPFVHSVECFEQTMPVSYDEAFSLALQLFPRLSPFSQSSSL
jgi:hypothetical protein